MTVTLNDAQKIIDAAKTKAKDINTLMCIAVADAGGNLVAFERMDGAWMGSINIAIDKAYTARAFDMSTQTLKTIASKPEDICFGINTTNNGRIVIFDGGIPLTQDGKVVGAIGVSGGFADTEDHPVADAGAQVFNS